eukprot:TRINITY_DN606_c0_g1_i2.p1 TRINITY_DN606_c0_g1~~TRINITY_DN606_c0_g1_i2.p1  ORF type:complete len:119 (-),score=11.46 TRINITY_DN606_c0_g1_i2:63-419(-)
MTASGHHYEGCLAADSKASAEFVVESVQQKHGRCRDGEPSDCPFESGHFGALSHCLPIIVDLVVVSVRSPVGRHAAVKWFPVLCVDTCLLYTSDAADEEDSVDLGGRRIIKKKKKNKK